MFLCFKMVEDMHITFAKLGTIFKGVDKVKFCIIKVRLVPEFGVALSISFQR